MKHCSKCSAQFKPKTTPRFCFLLLVKCKNQATFILVFFSFCSSTGAEKQILNHKIDGMKWIHVSIRTMKRSFRWIVYSAWKCEHMAMSLFSPKTTQKKHFHFITEKSRISFDSIPSKYFFKTIENFVCLTVNRISQPKERKHLLVIWPSHD